MHLLSADAFFCGAVGVSDDVDAARRSRNKVTLEVVDGHGEDVRRNRDDGIGGVGEMETDVTIRFADLRDGLTHKETAIATGMIQGSCRCSGIRKGIMNHPLTICIGIGRVLQADGTPIFVVFILRSVEIFVIVEVETIGMEEIVTMVIDDAIDIIPDPGSIIIVNMCHQQPMSGKHKVPPHLLTVLQKVILIRKGIVEDAIGNTAQIERQHIGNIRGGSEVDRCLPIQQLPLQTGEIDGTPAIAGIAAAIHQVPFIDDRVLIAPDGIKIRKTEGMTVFMADSTDTSGLIVRPQFIAGRIIPQRDTISRRKQIACIRPDAPCSNIVTLVATISGIDQDN